MKNDNLEITIDGVNYRVIQTIKNTEFWWYDYQNFAYISEKNGKMGVFSQWQEKMLIEFEYDNITYAGNGIYIVIKNNKMGLIHPAYIEDDFYYDNLQVEIPCEYDFIHTLNAHGKCFVLQKNEIGGPAVCAYLAERRHLTKTFDRYQYFKEGYIELWDSVKRELLDTYTAETLADDTGYFVYEIYQTAAGIVIEEFAHDSEQRRLVFIREYFDDTITQDCTKVIDFDGELYVAFEEDECGYPLAKLFRIEYSDGTSTAFDNQGLEIK